MKPYPRCHRITGALSALVITTFLGLGFAQTSASQETKNPLKNYPKIPIKEGDRCFVCNTPLTESGVAFLYRGRRVAVGTFHVRTFFNNPLKYFSRLQPRGALFQEDIIPQSPLKPGWLVFGIWITLGLVAAAFCHAYSAPEGTLPGSLVFYWTGNQSDRCPGCAQAIPAGAGRPAPEPGQNSHNGLTDVLPRLWCGKPPVCLEVFGMRRSAAAHNGV